MEKVRGIIARADLGGKSVGWRGSGLARGRRWFDYATRLRENEHGARDPDAVPPQSGPVAQLGARFHGMEEVVGSIPTRSTRFNNLRFPLLAVW